MKVAAPRLKPQAELDGAKPGRGMFSGIVAVFVAAGMNRCQMEVLKRLLCSHGGQVRGQLQEEVNYVIAADTSCLRTAAILNQLTTGQVVASITWLVDSFTAGHRLPVTPYLLRERVTAPQQSAEPPPVEYQLDSGRACSPPAAVQAGHLQEATAVGREEGTAGPLHEPKAVDGDRDTGGGHGSAGEEGPPIEVHRSGAQGGQRGQDEEASVLDLNEHLTGPLAELRDIYELALGDTWRALTYKKAVATLQRVPFSIADQDAARAIPGLGRSVQDKICEILNTGRLQKLESLKSDPKVSTVQLFSSVWGIGVVTARSLYELGHRTLEDLATHAPNLSSLARIGLRYHHDIAQRISREEVAELEAFVRAATTEICPGALVQVTGSYRRGASSCGDIDILLTHPDGSSHVGLLGRVLDKLYAEAFLKAGQRPPYRSTKADAIDTYLGICHLPGKTYARRIDIKAYPHALWPFALVHFTGNDILNRKIRYYANQLGMKLSDHGLFRRTPQGLLRGVGCETEEEIFDALGVPYCEPPQRNWSGPEIDHLIRSLPRGSSGSKQKKQRWI